MNFPGRFLVPSLLLFSSLIFSTQSFGHSVTDLSNIAGKLTGGTGGLSLSGSTLIVITGFNGGNIVAGDLGTVSFTSGALTSGSLRSGATLAGGGTFKVEGNGTNGISAGVLFSGTFSGAWKWVIMDLENGTHNYTLTGEVHGMRDGKPVDGVTMVLAINTGKQYFNGASTISRGDAVLSTSVSEPSTFALFGTGTFVLARTLRRKAFAAR